MITSINAIRFVRSKKCKKVNPDDFGLKANTGKGGKYIWESGIVIKTEYPNEIVKILDGNLKEVFDCWDADDCFDILGISGLKIGKTNKIKKKETEENNQG